MIGLREHRNSIPCRPFPNRLGSSSQAEGDIWVDGAGLIERNEDRKAEQMGSPPKKHCLPLEVYYRNLIPFIGRSCHPFP